METGGSLETFLIFLALTFVEFGGKKKKKRKGKRGKRPSVECAARTKTKVATLYPIMTLEFFVKVSTTMMGSYLVKGKNQFEGFSTLSRVLDVRISNNYFRYLFLTLSLSLLLSPLTFPLTLFNINNPI